MPSVCDLIPQLRTSNIEVSSRFRRAAMRVEQVNNGGDHLERAVQCAYREFCLFIACHSPATPKPRLQLDFTLPASLVRERRHTHVDLQEAGQILF